LSGRDKDPRKRAPVWTASARLRALDVESRKEWAAGGHMFH